MHDFEHAVGQHGSLAVVEVAQRGVTAIDVKSARRRSHAWDISAGMYP